MSNTPRQFDKATSKSARVKSIRTKSLALSVLLNSALFGALLLNPIKFAGPAQNEADLGPVMGDLAPLGAPAQSLSGSAVMKSLSKTSEPRTPTQKPIAEKTPAQLMIKKPQVVTDTSVILPVLETPETVMPKDISDLVRELLESSSNTEPIDVQSLNDALAAQLQSNSNATIEPASSHGTAGSGQKCRVVEDVSAVLQGDTELKSALLEIPRYARSVANVIMVWDGDWIGHASPRQDSAEPAASTNLPKLLKARFEAIAHSISPDCMSEPISGPVFILVEGDPEPTILTIGSGIWQWRDLMAPELLPSGTMIGETLTEFQARQRLR